MTHTFRRLLAAAGLVLAGVVAACSHDMTTGAPGAVRTVVALHAVSTGTTSGPSLAAMDDSGGMRIDTGKVCDDDRDCHGPFSVGKISKADVDSLTVDVSKVEVLQVQMDTNKSDSAEAKEDSAKSASDSAEMKEDSTERADTARGEGDRGDDHENDERTWISLDVTAGGHIDLLNLPDSAKAGITVATGSLPAGTYKHVRLFVMNATIFLKNQIVTPTGDTLKAGVGIPVLIPSADSTGAAIKTDERFTVTGGSSSVQLFFDADDTIRHIVVTGDGKIIVPPVIH